MDTKRLEDIIDFIETLDPVEHLDVIRDIFKILYKAGVPFSENEKLRRCSFRTADISTETMDEIAKYIKFTIDNRHAMEMREQAISSIVGHEEEEEDSELVTVEPIEIPRASLPREEEVPPEPKKRKATKGRKGYGDGWNKVLRDCKTAKSNKVI